MTRKSFIHKIITYWTAITSMPVFYAMIRYVTPPNPPSSGQLIISGGKRSSYTPGTVRMVREGKDAFFVRESPSGQIKSFSAKCTHLGCLVEYREDQGRIRCNCHGSVFDLDGNNISGPAPAPLRPARVEIRNDEVIITVL